MIAGSIFEDERVSRGLDNKFDGEYRQADTSACSHAPPLGSLHRDV